MKQIISLVFLVVILILGIAWYVHVENVPALTSPPIADALKPPTSAAPSVAEAANDQSVAAGPASVLSDGYTQHSIALQDGLAKRDPIAVEQFLELTGACQSVQHIRHGVTPGEHFMRMREYCDGYTEGMQPESIDEMWEMSLTALLAERMARLEGEKGSQAVAHEIGQIVDDGSAYEVRVALQYAAEHGVVPEPLRELAGNIDPSNHIADQLDMLSQIQFCKKGGGCGSNDFETLRACVVLGPCQPGDGLLEVMRRKTTPHNFNMAMQMSNHLQNRQ